MRPHPESKKRRIRDRNRSIMVDRQYRAMLWGETNLRQSYWIDLIDRGMAPTWFKGNWVALGLPF